MQAVKGGLEEEDFSGEGLEKTSFKKDALLDLGGPWSPIKNADKQLVVCGGVVPKSSDVVEFFELDEDSILDPLCAIPQGFNWDARFSDWVLRKVNELKDCVCLL